jgi:hypothetical protein
MLLSKFSICPLRKNLDSTHDFKVLSNHFSEETEEKLKRTQPRQPVAQLYDPN